MKAKSQFEFVPRDTDESEFLDLVDLGGVAFSVETVIWGGISGDEDSRNVVSDMAYSHISHVMWHDVSISVTWRTRDTTYPYVWRDSSICVTCLHVTWRMHRCDTTYSHRCDMQYIRGLFGDEEHILRHDALSFISRDMMFPHVWHDIHVTWRIHMCDMTRPYAWKASLAPRIWFFFLFLSIYSILQCADPRASATQGFPCVCAVFHSSSCSVTLPRASPGPWLIFSIPRLIFSIHVPARHRVFHICVCRVSFVSCSVTHTKASWHATTHHIIIIDVPVRHRNFNMCHVSSIITCHDSSKNLLQRFLELRGDKFLNVSSIVNVYNRTKAF